MALSMANKLEKLILIRHPQTMWEDMVKDPESPDYEKKLLGQTDVELSARGKEQAQKIADFLGRFHIDYLYSSPLKRARTLAERINDVKNIELKLDDSLKEINFGYCEGLSFSALRERYPHVFEDYVNRAPSLAFPGGESLADFIKRVNDFLKRLISCEKGGTALVVAHGGVTRALLCYCLGLASDFIWNIKQDYGAINILTFFNGKFIIEKLNHTLWEE